ncbi:dienelactone hydrolase family protein [Phenylobacterium sp. LjRoot225]|uniref:dienelactone hydrolase family protein n=1 Tax=Phenylobacterium sp. LjRoot225 TaxID=3342285 RepID=UPI003ECCFC54
MCDGDRPAFVPYTGLTRRTFGALATAAAASGAATAAGAAARDVVERDVTVRTADGTADAALFHPQGKGQWPGVLFWADIKGLRPAMRDMARRLASSGYVVLVPNPFYRSARAPVVPADANFQDPATRETLTGMRQAMTDAGVGADARAYVAYLDALSETSPAKLGVQGYCMGGPLSFRTAAAAPDRIGAVASFHGGGLTTSQPNSPHLLVESTKAAYLVAVARNDDLKDPTSKTILRETFARTHKVAVVDVYDGDHGWCVVDSAAYNQAEAERAWTTLLGVYKAHLV